AAAIAGDRLRLCLDGTAEGPTLDELAAAPPAAIPEPEPEDLLSVVFTSGTTGTPKAVGISQRALIARAAVMGVDWGPEPGDAFVGWAPMFHISASDYLFTTVVLGGTYVVEDGFDAGRIAAIVRR